MLEYASEPNEAYTREYGGGRTLGRAFVVGMNPGPWGMASRGPHGGGGGAVLTGVVRELQPRAGVAADLEGDVLWRRFVSKKSQVLVSQVPLYPGPTGDTRVVAVCISVSVVRTT